MIRLFKTGTYWICHITVACSLAFLITGSWSAALAIGRLEPSVQAVVFYRHEVAWDRVQFRRGASSRSMETARLFPWRPALADRRLRNIPGG